MSHAHRVFAGTPQASLTPTAHDIEQWPVDLGEVADLRTAGATGPVKVGFEIGAEFIEVGYGGDALPDLVPSYFRYPKPGTMVEGGSKKELQLQGSPTVIGETGVGDAEIMEQVRSESYEIERLNKFQWREKGVASIVILDGLLLKSVTHQGGTSRPIISSAVADLERLFNNLAYLQPTRKRPSRTYPISPPNKPQAIGYAGEWTATVLHRQGNQTVTDVELPQIPKTFDEAKRRMNERAAERSRSCTLLEAVGTWLARLGLANSVQSSISNVGNGNLELRVTLPNQDAHNIVEIGFGVSQVVPILTCGLLQPENSLFIVDLPEAHLHPGPQSELADFFCALALSGRSCLIETHSEMFFHRLRTRAEMLPKLRDLINVYFIDEPEKGVCRQPRRIGLKLDDEMNWPAGFFQEGWDMEVQISSLRRARKSLG